MFGIWAFCLIDNRRTKKVLFFKLPFQTQAAFIYSFLTPAILNNFFLNAFSKLNTVQFETSLFHILFCRKLPTALYTARTIFCSSIIYFFFFDVARNLSAKEWTCSLLPSTITSVLDLDVFGPPGSASRSLIYLYRSGSFHQQATK